MCGFHQGQRYILPHLKAGYMDAIFFLSRTNFFLASRGEPYMTPLLFATDPATYDSGYREPATHHPVSSEKLQNKPFTNLHLLH
jgi:hypothetical protein